MLNLSYDGVMSIARVGPKYSVRRLGSGTQNMFENERRGVKMAPDPRIGRGEIGNYPPPKKILWYFLSL